MEYGLVLGMKEDRASQYIARVASGLSPAFAAHQKYREDIDAASLHWASVARRKSNCFWVLSLGTIRSPSITRSQTRVRCVLRPGIKSLMQDTQGVSADTRSQSISRALWVWFVTVMLVGSPRGYLQVKPSH